MSVRDRVRVKESVSSEANVGMATGYSCKCLVYVCVFFIMCLSACFASVCARKCCLRMRVCVCCCTSLCVRVFACKWMYDEVRGDVH